jgi:hypothetical protein
MIVSPAFRPPPSVIRGSPASDRRGGSLIHRWGVLPALFALFLLSAPLSGQLLTRGDVQGVVRGGGLPVADASVSIMPQGGGGTLEQFPPRDGSFSFRALMPGLYEVRVEAVGYRPLVIRGVDLAPGRTALVPVELTPDPPPVTQVDTVLMAPGSGERSEPGVLTWIPASSLDGLPDRNRRVSDLDRLVPRRQGPGSEGLPEQASVVALDGVVLRQAIRTGSGVDPEGSFPIPRSGLGGVAMMGVGDDPEWGQAPGGVVSLVPAVGGRGGESSLWASGSAGGLWTSGQFPGTIPATTSFWGGGTAAFSLDGDRGRGLVAAEARRVQDPRPRPVFGSALAAILARSDLPGDAATLGDTGVDETTAISVMSRVDWMGEGGRGGGATVAFGRSETTGTPAGSTPVPFSDPHAGVRADLAAVVNYLVPVGDRVRLEARGGVHRTERDHAGAAPGAAAALLVEPGGALGSAPAFPLRVQRSTATASALMHFWDGNQYAKGGIEGRLSAHEREGLTGQLGEFAFDGFSGFAQGRGATRVVVPGPAEGSFQVPAYGLFLRVGWTPRPGLELTAGGRRDVEYLPSEIRPDTLWGRLTGLADSLPRTAGGLSGSAGLTWDPGNDGATVVRLSGGVYRGEMDPGMLADLIQLDGRARVRRTFGPAAGWPSAPSGGQEGALLALPGLDVTPPMSLRGSAGILRRIGAASTVEVHAVVRRSSGLIRVADLNLIRLPRATIGVRDFFGIPAREGTLLGAEPGSNRLFPAYDAVWAQNTDGTSDYLGVGGTLGHGGSGWEVRASYLFSRTEDNLPGLLSGDPLAGLNPFPLREVDWREGRSDLDLPHRATVEARLTVPGLEGSELSAVYTVRSGLPFTPGFRPGVDMNGDGSWSNDPAILTGNPDVSSLLTQWGCELPVEEGIVPRNGCRGPNVHDLDLRLVVGVPVGGLALALTGEVLGVFERSEGLRDTALYRVDRSGTANPSPDGSLVVPLVANPDFGNLLRPSIPGRLFRIGIRLTP